MLKNLKTIKGGINDKILIILSVVLLSIFCYNAFQSPQIFKASAAGEGIYGDEYFYADLLKVEGETMRDLGITGYYINSDTIEVAAPDSGDPDAPFFGYYNTSYTTNTGTETEYTINIYNLFKFEVPEVTETTQIEIKTKSNLRFYINNFCFYDDTVGEDYFSFIPVNKTVNLFDLLEKIYPDELSQGNPELYPGTPEWHFSFDVSDNGFDLCYTPDMDDNNDVFAVFSKLSGFVINEKGFISNKSNEIKQTDDGIYYYEISDNAYTYWYYGKNYLNFQPIEQTGGGFYLADETLKANNAGPLGQNYNFDFAQVNGYGKDRYNFLVDKDLGYQLTYDQWNATLPINYTSVDFNCLSLHYTLGGEIYALYQSIFPQYSNASMKRISSSDSFRQNIVMYWNNEYYYNSFICCFSPYVGEVKIISTDEPPAKFQAGKIANIISAALWVGALPVMLIGSIINGIGTSINGGNFFEGFSQFSRSISEGLSDFGEGIADFVETVNENFLPQLPKPVKDLGENPVTWLVLVLVALIAFIVIFFIVNNKKS